MASVAKLPVGEVRRETRDLTAVVLYFLVFPIGVSLGETLLQFPIANRDSLVLSFAFATAFTLPGTFFAWLATMVLARLPGLRRLPVVVLLVAGYALSITVFSPYNRYVHEVASQMLPHMRDVATIRHQSSGWWQIVVIMLTNLPMVLIWIVINLAFMARLGFPNFGRVSAAPAPLPVSERPALRLWANAGVPDFCRDLGIGSLSELCYVSAEEHYLRVGSVIGVRVIRHPFKAAIEQLPAACGLQVHRSHWVAFGRVARIEGKKDVHLLLVDGTQIPVSKSYLQAVRLMEATLLAA